MPSEATTIHDFEFDEDSDGDEYADEEETDDSDEETDAGSEDEEPGDTAKHWQERTQRFRTVHERDGTMATTILDVLQYMSTRSMDLPLLLDELFYKNQDLLSDAKARYGRTALMGSVELPGIIRRWHHPPRTHKRGTRTKGARRVLDRFSEECVASRAKKEMQALRSIMLSPRKELSEDTLLSISWEETIDKVRNATPTLWSLLHRCACTPLQMKRNIYKKPEPLILMAIAMLSFSRSQNHCMLQKLLTIYFKACGLSAKGFDTLHSLGITMSQKWAYDGIDMLAEYKRKALLEDIDKYLWFGCHDNLNISFRVYEQRIGSKSHFDSGTAGAIIITKEPAGSLPSNDIIQAHKAAGEERMLKFKDILELERLAAPRLRLQAVHRVLRFLIETAAFDFSTYQHKDSATFARPPPVHQLPAGPNNITSQYVLDTVHMEEASYEGNDRVLDEWFRQLKLDTDAEQKKTARRRFIAWIGDQLTVSRLRGLRRFRSQDMNPWQRMEWLQEMFGFMHAEVALEHSFHDQYYLTSSGVGLKHAFDILNRKGLHSPSVKGTFHHDMREALQHVSEAHFLDIWRLVSGVDDLAELRDKTPAELYAFAEQIVSDYASTAGLSKLRNQPRKEQDDILMQSVMFARDTLDYLNLDDAIHSGDVGLMVQSLPRLLFRFAGGRNKNYAVETLELLQCYHREWHPSVRDFILNNCLLANTTGREEGFLPFDQLMEHVIRDIKCQFAAIGPFSSWEYIGRTSPAIPTQRKVKDHVEAQVNHFRRGKRHTTPEKDGDVARLQAAYKTSRVHENLRRRLSKENTAADVIAAGSEGKRLKKAINTWMEQRVDPRSTKDLWSDSETRTDGEDAMS